MKCKWLFFVVLFVPALLVGCGGGSSSGGGSGSATFTLSDTDPDFLDTFWVNIVSVDVVSNAGKSYRVFPSEDDPLAELSVDLLKYQRERQILGVRDLPVGTYTSAVLTFTGAGATSGANSVEVYPDSGTVDFPLTSQLVVERNGTYALDFDFDLVSSLQDGGTDLLLFSPVIHGGTYQEGKVRAREFQARVSTVSTGQDFMEIEVLGQDDQGNQITVTSFDLLTDDNTIVIDEDFENQQWDEQAYNEPFRGFCAGDHLDIKADVRANGEVYARSIEYSETGFSGQRKVELEGILTHQFCYGDTKVLQLSILNVKQDTDNLLDHYGSTIRVAFSSDDPPLFYYETNGQVVTEKNLHVGVRVEVEGEIQSDPQTSNFNYEWLYNRPDNSYLTGMGPTERDSDPDVHHGADPDVPWWDGLNDFINDDDYAPSIDNWEYQDAWDGHSRESDVPTDSEYDNNPRNESFERNLPWGYEEINFEDNLPDPINWQERDGDAPEFAEGDWAPHQNSERLWVIHPSCVEIQEERMSGIVSSVNSEGGAFSVQVNTIEDLTSDIGTFKTPKFRFDNGTEFWVAGGLPVSSNVVQLGDDVEVYGTFVPQFDPASDSVSGQDSPNGSNQTNDILIFSGSNRTNNPLHFDSRIVNLAAVEFEGDAVGSADFTSSTFLLTGDGSDFGLSDPVTIIVNVSEQTKVVQEDGSSVTSSVTHRTLFNTVESAEEITVKGYIDTTQNPPVFWATMINYELP